MTTRDLRTLLVEAEAETQRVELPREADRRLRQRLFEQRSEGSRRWVWALAVAAALVLAVVARSGKAREQTFDGLRLTASSSDLEAAVGADRVIAVSKGTCTLLDVASGERIDVAAPAKLRRDPQGLRVLAGTAELTVQKRAAGLPSLRVLVSHGAIEILGTRFTVVQEDERGSVTLHEGEIRFHDAGGGTRALAPGERLEWPRPAPAATPALDEAPAVVPIPPVVKSKKSTRPPVAAPIVFRDPEDLLQQVDVLRSRGLFPEAARYLTHGLTTPLRPATRERFSYELGSILTYQLGDRASACRHWQEHERRYPDGRYQTEVLQAAAHARCAGSAR